MQRRRGREVGHRSSLFCNGDDRCVLSIDDASLRFERLQGGCEVFMEAVHDVWWYIGQAGKDLERNDTPNVANLGILVGKEPFAGFPQHAVSASQSHMVLVLNYVKRPMVSDVHHAVHT